MFDLSQENPIPARYCENDPSYQRTVPKMIQNFCIARRLVEAGARVVRSTIVVGTGMAVTA